MVAEYEGCRLLLVDKKISTARDIVGEFVFLSFFPFEAELLRKGKKKGVCRERDLSTSTKRLDISGFALFQSRLAFASFLASTSFSTSIPSRLA